VSDAHRPAIAGLRRRPARRQSNPWPPQPAARIAGAWVKVVISVADAHRSSDGPTVEVRCLECFHRLFDVIEGRYFNAEYGMLSDGRLHVVRKCPDCGRLNRGYITTSPGEELVEGLSGPWYCCCGRSLAHADPVRGRVRVRCRCGIEARVVAVEAIAVAEAPPPMFDDLAGAVLDSVADDFPECPF